MMGFKVGARSQDPTKSLVELMLEVSCFDKDTPKHTAKTTSHAMARRIFVAPARRQPCLESAPKVHMRRQVVVASRWETDSIGLIGTI